MIKIAKDIESAMADWATFYRADCVKSPSRIEEVAEILDDDEVFRAYCDTLQGRDVFKIGREDYDRRRLGHDGKANLCSNRWEEIIAYSMVNYCRSSKKIGEIGCALDYQVPMKLNKARKGINTGVGKAIDLVTENGNALYIIELKQPKTNESILRCLLEAFTYCLSVNHSRFAASFGRPNSKIGIGVVVFDGMIKKDEEEKRIDTGRQLEEYKKGRYKHFAKLVKRMEAVLRLPVLFQPMNYNQCQIKPILAVGPQGFELMRVCDGD